MKIGDRVFVRGYIDEIRKDTVIIRNAGGYFGTIPSEVIIGDLPPAQPMRKKGEWLECSVFDEPQGKRIEQWQSAKCSVCGKYHTTPYLYYFDWFNWCPSCGSDMRRKTDA